MYYSGDYSGSVALGVRTCSESCAAVGYLTCGVEMRACYVNHHIVSRGRDAASTARRMRGDATSSSSRLRSVPSRTIYRVRYISLGRERALLLLHTSVYYMCVHIRARRPEAALRAPRLDIRSARLFENEWRSERSSKRSDGRCIILVSYLTSIAELPQVAITTSAIFFLGELSAIKRSVDLLRTSPRAQRDVLIVRLDRYDSSLYAGPASINPLVGIN